MTEPASQPAHLPATEPIPPTRWELAGEGRLGYGRRFAQLVEEGADIAGEARLADVLVPRQARILDAGSGMGRVAGYLHARGHHVTAVEKDRDLVAQSRSTYPEVEVIESDILALSSRSLAHDGRPSAYDLVVLVGNVMILAASETERRLLSTVRGLLAPSGRVLVGFHLTGGPAGGRAYSVEEFTHDASASGLTVELRARSYDLRPPCDDSSEEYAVFVLGETTVKARS